MSATHDTSDGYTCQQCGGPRTKEGVGGSFCSQTCWNRHKGEKLLNNIKHNHCFCSNCGARLKEIEKPTDEALRSIDGYHSTTAVVGFQYRTPSADTGEIDVKTDVQGRETVSTGTVCGECGNTNSGECFPEDRHRHLVEYGHRFLESLEEKREEGVHDKDVDDAVFFEALVESEDLALSLGRAIQGE